MQSAPPYFSLSLVVIFFPLYNFVEFTSFPKSFATAHYRRHTHLTWTTQSTVIWINGSFMKLTFSICCILLPISCISIKILSFSTCPPSPRTAEIGDMLVINLTLEQCLFPPFGNRFRNHLYCSQVAYRWSIKLHTNAVHFFWGGGRLW